MIPHVGQKRPWVPTWCVPIVNSLYWARLQRHKVFDRMRFHINGLHLVVDFKSAKRLESGDHQLSETLVSSLIHSHRYVPFSILLVSKQVSLRRHGTVSRTAHHPFLQSPHPSLAPGSRTLYSARKAKTSGVPPWKGTSANTKQTTMACDRCGCG